MKTAVVILNWNGKSLLEKFLYSIVEHSPEATVYVADNASTDGSIAFLAKNFPTVEIIRNSVNGGYAKGYNDALSKLNEDIFILLNSDVEVTKNWLPPLINHFKAHGKTAIAQPKLLDYKNKAYFEYSGAAGGFVDKLGYPYCRGRIFNTIEKDTGQYDDEFPVFWASGACLAIRRTVFQELNGFDETYFAHQEEIDICWRAQNAGFRVMYLPQSKVYHLGGATLSVMNPRKTFFNFRNSLFNILKNVPGRNYWFILFFRLLLDGVAAMMFLFQGKPRHIGSIFKAHGSFYRNFSSVWKKRQTYDQTSSPYAKVNSIVWKYFIIRTKHFKNL